MSDLETFKQAPSKFWASLEPYVMFNGAGRFCTAHADLLAMKDLGRRFARSEGGLKIYESKTGNLLASFGKKVK